MRFWIGLRCLICKDWIGLRCLCITHANVPHHISPMAVPRNTVIHILVSLYQGDLRSGKVRSYLADLQPLTVGPWTINSLELQPSSWPEELTTTNPILRGILLPNAGIKADMLRDVCGVNAGIKADMFREVCGVNAGCAPV